MYRSPLTECACYRGKINLLSYRKLKGVILIYLFGLKRIKLFHFQPCLPEAKNRCCFPVIQTKKNGSFFIVSKSVAILTGPFSKTKSILSKSYRLDYYSRGQHSPMFTFQASCIADNSQWQLVFSICCHISNLICMFHRLKRLKDGLPIS